MYRIIIRNGLIAVVLMALTGCFGGGGGGAARSVEQYQLSYAVPAPVSVAPVPATITLERFSAGPLYSRFSMIFKPDSFRVDEYQYHHWRLAPADMVTELMRRDMRASAVFQGVFSGADLQRTRYRLTGRVEEFHEAALQGVVALQITLFDLEQPFDRQIVFQKLYRQATVMNDASPAALAKALSLAMEQVSRGLQQDIMKVLSAHKEK